MKSVCDLLESWADTRPDRLLFEFRDSRGLPTQRHSFQSFHRQTQSLAAHLLDTPGLSHGDRVLLAYPPGLGIITGLIACARAGLIGVPVPVPKTENDLHWRRLRAVADDCQATAVLSDTVHVPRIRQLATSSATPTAWQVFNTDEFCLTATPLVCTRSQAVLFLQYTSGSTGQPRGVIVSHDNVIANAKATLDHAPLVGVTWLPQHHDMGLIGYYLFPIVSGGTSVGFATADFLRRPALWMRVLSDVRATYTSSPNFGYEYCLREGKIRDGELDGVDLSSIQVLMNASEPARLHTVERFYRRFEPYGLRRSACTVAYGLAENTLTVTQGGRGAVQVDRAALTARRIDVVEHTEGRSTVTVASCGKPASGVTVHLIDADTGRNVEGSTVGEICVEGPSVARGYWNNDEATGHTFTPVLRTGDLGFLYRDELYVCGRIKDVLIVGGAKFFPDDMEDALAIGGVRPRGICAFQSDDDRIVMLVEPMRIGDLPDPARLADIVRRSCGLVPDVLHIVAPKTIALTTSGKIARADTRALFMGGTVPVLATYTHQPASAVSAPDAVADWRRAVQQAFVRHGVTNDDATLAEHGIDSLAMTELQIELEDVLARVGAGAVAQAIDATLLQRLSLRDLVSMLSPIDSEGADGVGAARSALMERRSCLHDAVMAQMLDDSHPPEPSVDPRRSSPGSEREKAILLTGGTGFVGPFLLDELLQQTDSPILVLVRAANAEHAMARVENALENARVLTPALRQMVRDRVRPVCGDLSLPRWGLGSRKWRDLACRVGEVFHNGACVNYVLTYEAMRDANVQGTRTALQLALDSGARAFNLISSTFIFGWTAKGVLLETDSNAEMQELDFGYAQSKWVAERQAQRARAHGLDVRVFRPALISVSTRGAGDSNDVAIRMLAFMIRHGIAVDTPNQLSMVAADVIARNIVGISRLSQCPTPAFHVTADRYYSITELTRMISRDYGYTFTYYDIPGFIAELNRRCSPTDSVYPLLDFFNRSADKMAAMQLKRYSSAAYQDARARLAKPLADPSLAQTAQYLMRYLLDRRLVEPRGVAV